MRLIDADNLAPDICDAEIEYGTKPVHFSANAIDFATTIDAVPVVRCRECKEGEIDDPDFPDQYYCHAGCGWNKGNFYCAYGERKEGAD